VWFSHPLRSASEKPIFIGEIGRIRLNHVSPTSRRNSCERLEWPNEHFSTDAQRGRGRRVKKRGPTISRHNSGSGRAAAEGESKRGILVRAGNADCYIEFNITRACARWLVWSWPCSLESWMMTRRFPITTRLRVGALSAAKSYELVFSRRNGDRPNCGDTFFD
jgi:hypothetical protein